MVSRRARTKSEAREREREECVDSFARCRAIDVDAIFCCVLPPCCCGWCCRRVSERIHAHCAYHSVFSPAVNFTVAFYKKITCLSLLWREDTPHAHTRVHTHQAYDDATDEQLVKYIPARVRFSCDSNRIIAFLVRIHVYVRRAVAFGTCGIWIAMDAGRWITVLLTMNWLQLFWKKKKSERKSRRRSSKNVSLFIGDGGGDGDGDDDVDNFAPNENCAHWIYDTTQSNQDISGDFNERIDNNNRSYQFMWRFLLSSIRPIDDIELIAVRVRERDESWGDWNVHRQFSIGHRMDKI